MDKSGNETEREGQRSNGWIGNDHAADMRSPMPVQHFLQARLNEAARAADAFACSKQAARRFETALEELSASRYDEAIGGLGFMVKSMNFDLKVNSQVLFFPITSKPKSIEIP
jgi:hypothetical protein